MRCAPTSRVLQTSACALALAGCAVGPNYHAPHAPTPAHFMAASVASATPSAPAAVDPALWWRALNDPELDSLIARAIKANPDIEIALTRLQAARTAEAVVLGGALPQADAAVGAGHGTGSDLARGRAPAGLASADHTTGDARIEQVAGFDASWELDLFGKYRREFEARRYDAQAAAWTRDAVLVSVIADVARAYIDMRGLQARLAITRQNITSARGLRDIAQLRSDRGLTNELDLDLAERELATLQSVVAPLVAQSNAAQNSIAALLGQYPEDLAAELARPGLIPDIPEHIAPGLPVELLERRADIREAERQLAAATARVGVATANLFPRLALSGGAGTQSASIGTGPGSHIWSVGPSLYWPLLDFGALDALVDIADLQTHERLVNYKRAIIVAVRDADTAIGDFSAAQERLENLARAMTASERAVSIAAQRYDRGLTDYLNVADAERQQFALEDEYTATQQNAADAFVTLYRSLGGGWEQYQEVPAIRRPQPALVAMLHRLARTEEAAQTDTPDGR